MRKKILIIATSVFIVLLTIGIGVYIFIYSEGNLPNQNNQKYDENISKFKSDIEFNEYLYTSNANELFPTYDKDIFFGLDGMKSDAPGESLSPNQSGGDDSTDVDRYSQTNVQVLNIDEADIVKTDGNNIYYSQESYYYPYYDVVREIDYDPKYIGEENPSKTFIVDALPVEKMSVLSKIDANGELYLHEDTLVIENRNLYQAYDVSNELSSKQIWKLELESDQTVIASRLYDGSLYIVTGMYPKYGIDCAIPLLKDDQSNSISVNCTDIYYPPTDLYNPQNITVIKVDISNGYIEDKISFLGGSYNTIVYMSENSLYITYPAESDVYEQIYLFIMENDELFTKAIRDRATVIHSYDISSNSKLSELEKMLEVYSMSLNEDERLLFQNNLNNAFKDYLDKNVRSFGGTGIVKIGVDNLEISNNTVVQGSLLNQFSLDEYQGYLRVAVTRSGGWWGKWFSGEIESQSDVVILNSSLNVVGEVTGLGLTERIYSVRFLEEKAYVVTFRETDPFYVLDLSKPTSPKLEGELKIPGYSSYLHPLKDNIILGVGIEDSRVKLSLFDVSRPSDPVEISKYSMTDYWTDVSNNHHAFMQDAEKELFFIPSSSGGFIYSYKNNSIELIKVVTDQSSVKRALFINDYFYVIFDDSIVVFDQNNWKQVNKITL